MNYNALIAILVLKNIISKDEAERLVEYLNNKPQPTLLNDALTQVTELLDPPAPAILPQVAHVGGPVQQAETAAALDNPPKESKPKAPATTKAVKKPADKPAKK